MHENFFHKLKIYYEDTDSGGVVYYANYLKYLERARTEALFSIGFSNKIVQDQFNSLIIVKSCNIEYRKSAHLEDELTVRSFVKSITKTSFFMNQIITKGEETIVEVTLTSHQKKYYKAIYEKNTKFLYRGKAKGGIPSLINIVMELRKQHGIDVPEAEYRELESLDSSADYLLPKFESGAAA